jgi:hypothetical protein
METAQPWRYAVQLRVVAQEPAEDDDWFADADAAGIATTRADHAIAAAMVAASPLDPQAIAAAMDEFARQLAAGLGDSGTDTRSESEPERCANRALPYGLTIHQTALLGSEGDSLGLPATVAGATDGEPCPPLTLAVRLSDPQTAESVALTATPLAMATLPASITLSVTVPTGLSTRLLLGEVGLLSGNEVVALQGFTVTVDVALLFNAIANLAETNTDLGVVFPADGADETFPAPNFDHKTWDIAGRTAPHREMPSWTLPRSSPELPPKIYYPSPHEVATHQPTLPLVGDPNPAPAPPPQQNAPAASPGLGRGLSLPPLAQPARAEDPVVILSGRSPQTPQSRKPHAQEPQLLSHEAMGFKDLKLQDRFWNRLNELAVTLQQEAQANRATGMTMPEPVGLAEGGEAAPEFIPFAGEVVIYDDEDPALRDVTAASAAVPVADIETAAEMVMPPMPSLVLPEGDLTAGEPVLVTLRVPFHPNRLYLKVWITDPQTRTLADEPRQLMNLLPNGQGQLEGSLQLTAPLGCLEAWFEAIAIDMVTQQESYKASVSRAIIPAGLSSSSLDEFQL